MTKMNKQIADITARIAARSRESRADYLDMIASRRPDSFARLTKSEGNLAHASAGCAVMDKVELLGAGWPNIGIITSYNDMLSAHQPFETYPEIIRGAARQAGATAQVAGGVPAMCDGVTQGEDGMELSLFSRDVIAMASTIGLSHDVYDAALHLGVCDKIVPGLVIAALRFGWIPSVFVPAGPMPSGLPNPEKARVRQLFATGQVGRDELLKAESESYHSPGTCTFYGTANSNQMLMEVMGLHLPGAAFVPPNTPLRQALTEAATQRAAAITAQGEHYMPAGVMIDERSIVNAIVGLVATGGSTNHALHLPAMAAAAGISITLDDFADISAVVPLLTRIYPNGPADVNHFHAAGGMSFVIRELMAADLLHADARTVMGTMRDQTREAVLEDGQLVWREGDAVSGDLDILRPVSDPFSTDGGLRMMDGALGRGVCKVSAVKPEHRIVEAPARVFESQGALKAAFEAGELNKDFIAVVRFQGPSANGMPELHSLSPVLGALQDKGHRVALVTDGRMSGASGKVPSAIHMGPEAANGGPLAFVEDGDLIRLDVDAGTLEIKADLSSRTAAVFRPNKAHIGLGRELFGSFRADVSTSEQGATFFSLLQGTK